MTEAELQLILSRESLEFAIHPGRIGLGLFISTNLVNAHSGHITLKSEPDKIAELTVSLSLEVT